MRLFWQKGRKIWSTERFKTSAILNARFRESYFKLKVNGRAVTSQTGQQPNVEVGFVCPCPRVHGATDLEKIPFRISKDEAPFQ